MIDGVGIGFVYGDDVFDVLGYVVNARPEDNELHLYYLLLVVPEVKYVLSDSLPVEVVVSVLDEVYADVDGLSIKDVLDGEGKI